MKKLHSFTVYGKTKTGKKFKHLGGAVAKNRKNALKQVKWIWSGSKYVKFKIGHKHK